MRPPFGVPGRAGLFPVLALLLVTSALPLSFGAGPAAPATPANGAGTPAGGVAAGLRHDAARDPLIPLHRPTHMARFPTPEVVDPTAYYGSEPAPIGIADFGVNASGGAYRYQTSEFVGSTVLRQLTVDNPSLSSGTTALSIQLNVILTFTHGSKSYLYWVQDVAFIDTNGSGIQFENNIWNFSSGNGSMNAQSISGNGTIYGKSFYAAGASAGLSGNDIRLSYPARVDLIVQTKMASNQPEVIFQYRDGYGAITYDNAYFPWATGATALNYTVDGSNYIFYGLYEDAELVLGGPGGGSTTAATAANLSVGLSYFNGHNLEAVPNAFAQGSDTGETISGLVPHFASDGRNGTLWDNLTQGGGSVGRLYGPGTVGTAEVLTQAPPGILVVNGTTGISYGAAPINLTLGPGNFTFAIYVHAVLYGEVSATISAGGFRLIYIDSGTVANVTFEESGLPSGTLWTVNYGPERAGSTTSSLTFQSPNGSFSWRLRPVAGFTANATLGLITVAGSDQVVSLNFTAIYYAVQLVESGLPNGTAWSLTEGNRSYPAVHGSVNLSLPNGTFGYRLGPVAGWIGAPSNVGSFQVVGAPETVTIYFRAFTFPVYLNASGLPAGTSWSATVNGARFPTTLGGIVAAEPNGSVAWQVAAPDGWNVTPASGSVLVLAGPATIEVVFRPFTFPVQFTEFGLTSGTLWSVGIGNADHASTNATVDFELPNGSFSYAIDPVLGYGLLTPTSSSFAVTDGPVQIEVEFVHNASIFGGIRGNFTPASATVLVDDAGVTTANGSFTVLDLLPGLHTVEVSAPGYVTVTDNVSVAAGITLTLTPIHLHVIPPTSNPPHATTPSSPDLTGEYLLVGVAFAAVVLIAATAIVRRRP